MCFKTNQIVFVVFCWMYENQMNMVSQFALQMCWVDRVKRFRFLCPFTLYTKQQLNRMELLQRKQVRPFSTSLRRSRKVVLGESSSVGVLVYQWKHFTPRNPLNSVCLMHWFSFYRTFMHWICSGVCNYCVTMWQICLDTLMRVRACVHEMIYVCLCTAIWK